MNMVQIGMIGVLGALLAIQFKGGKTEYGIYMSVAVSIVLFLCIVDRLEIFVRTIDEISRYISVDTGYQTIAVQIEVFSKLTILAMGMPILLALLETIQEFLV